VPPALRFGKYVIDGLLGPGGVTETYLAHVSHERDRPKGAAKGQTLFALKLLRRDRVDPSSWAKVAQRFVAAGQQLRDFRRPGFGRVFEVSDDASATFIVSEHVAGSDLARLLEACRHDGAGEPRLDARLAGIVAAEIARLLHVGHSAKPLLCHHGLSPSNVMVLPSGEVTLLDAGVAASLRGITEQPPDRWCYVAPELQGLDVVESPPSERRAVASDLYALGAVLHTLLYGRAPSRVSSVGPAFEATSSAPELPGKLGAALRTLLAAEPDDRPESAALLVDWLSNGLTSTRERQGAIAEGMVALESAVRAPSQAADLAVAEGAMGSSVLRPGPVMFDRAGAVRTFKERARRVGLVLTLLVAVGVLVLTRGDSCTEVPAASPLAGEPSRVAGPSATETANGAIGTSQPPGETRDPDPILSNVAGHLIVETIPPGASIWVDGTLRGTSFAKVFVGRGQHDVALVMAGHRMYRTSVETGAGVIIRRTLEAIPRAPAGPAAIHVTCVTQGRYPILIDEREVGHVCTSTVSVSAGRHQVGIYVPQQRKTYSVEAHAQSGATPALVTFVQ
jgi:hypothetical protein